MPWFEQFSSADESPLWLLAGIGLLVLILWFVPSIIALFRNRAHLRAIAILNVPGGLSWIVWTALIIWAASGKGPPANLAANTRQSLPWIAVAAAVIAAALVWHFSTQGQA